MKIIPRYVLKHFLPIFALAIVGFVGIYLIVDFFERVDSMLENHLPFREIYTYFLCKIPMILTQGIPMAAILSAIIALGMLKRNRELIAMETAGVNPSYFVAPIAVAALVLSVIHFCVAEFAARPLNQKLDETWAVNVEHRKPALWMNPENMWFRDENTIYQIRLYDREKNVMQIASIFFLDPQLPLDPEGGRAAHNLDQSGVACRGRPHHKLPRRKQGAAVVRAKTARFESYAKRLQVRQNRSAHTLAGKSCTATWKK